MWKKTFKNARVRSTGTTCQSEKFCSRIWDSQNRMDDDRKTLLREAFGESSDEDEAGIGESDEWSPSWRRIEEVPGLWLCRDFLSGQEQAVLLSEIEKEGWFNDDSHNQAMRFGDLPQWALELSNSVHDAVFINDHGSDSLYFESYNLNNEALFLPFDTLRREPLFDQLIVNMYHPGEGICAHVDLMRFQDGIAIVSLESSCVMHFTPVGDMAGQEIITPKTRIPVHLTPGSLVLLSGEARYHWKHEINREPGYQLWDSKEINQKRRISITLRKLCPTCQQKLRSQNRKVKRNRK